MKNFVLVKTRNNEVYAGIAQPDAYSATVVLHDAYYLNVIGYINPFNNTLMLYNLMRLEPCYYKGFGEIETVIRTDVVEMLPITERVYNNIKRGVQENEAN